MFFRRMTNRSNAMREFQPFKSQFLFRNFTAFKQPFAHLDDNRLHAACRMANTTYDFKNAIDAIDTNTASILSRQTNNNGDIPFDIISKRIKENDSLKHPIAEQTFYTMYNYLMPLMQKIDIKKLNTPVTPKQDETNADIILSCQLINETRKIIKESTSHPDFNSLPLNNKLELRKKLYRLRGELDELYPSEVSRYLNSAAILVMKESIANCEEFSYVAHYKLKEMNIKMNSEIYRIINGDHCFLVMNRDKNSDPYNWRTWGNKTIICDAWLGETYSANQIPTQLINAMGFGTNDTINVITSFNPSYHKLIPLSHVIMRNSLIAEIGLFKKKLAEEFPDASEEHANRKRNT